MDDGGGGFRELVRAFEGVSPYLLAVTFSGLVLAVLGLWRQNQRLWASRVADLRRTERSAQQMMAALNRLTRALVTGPCLSRQDRDRAEFNGSVEGEEDSRR